MLGRQLWCGRGEQTRGHAAPAAAVWPVLVGNDGVVKLYKTGMAN